MVQVHTPEPETRDSERAQRPRGKFQHRLTSGKRARQSCVVCRISGPRRYRRALVRDIAPLPVLLSARSWWTTGDGYRDTSRTIRPLEPRHSVAVARGAARTMHDLPPGKRVYSGCRCDRTAVADRVRARRPGRVRPERLVLHELLVRVTADLSVPDGSRIEDLGINFREMTGRLLAGYLDPRMADITAAFATIRRQLASSIEAALAAVMAGAVTMVAAPTQSSVSRWVARITRRREVARSLQAMVAGDLRRLPNASAGPALRKKLFTV